MPLKYFILCGHINPTMKKNISLIVLITLLFNAFVSAQTRKPFIQKEPAWVTINPIEYNSHHLDKEANNGYIDLNFERQVSLQEQSIYVRSAYKILSESGVQNSSEVNVSFDPSYSQLVFHTIKIIRGKETINKLQASKIKVIQQEDELSRFIYNGSLSAILILEDVRKGDIIEYSYTLKGFNPVFKGKYAGIFETSFSEPAYNLYYKVIVPQNRSIQIKNSLTGIACTKISAGNQTAYEWKLTNVPGIRKQDHSPSWYDPFSMVMVSEYQTWKEVNDWALTLFPSNTRPSQVMQSKIKELMAANATPEGRILAALRFVQDDVRYMGIEMGPRSHRPHDPNKILAQRFGDCKDKSYLLCVLLRAMGIEASPVLINTVYKKTVFDMLPSPTIFDHATVRVFLNGRYYWFDPTTAYQRGKLDSISYPDYQCGLVIHDTTTMLTTIPLQNKGMVDVREEFDIPDMSGKARLTVHTVYTGSFADNMREVVNSNSESEMKETYRKFYAQYYEKIEADSISYTDDEATGRLVLNEYYSIEDLWKLEDGTKKCNFSPYVINSLLRNPGDLKRTMPIEVVHPAKYREEIIIHVPDEWDATESMKNFDCAAFKLKAEYAYFYKKVKLKYEYESIKDHVMPNESAGFFASMKRMDDKLGYELSFTDGKTMSSYVSRQEDKGSKQAKYIIGLVIVLIVSTVIWTQRRK
jgi:transglutaminase-like putative cysteine protease